MVGMMANLDKKEIDPRIEEFERFEREVAQPRWLLPLRRAGLARFAEFGYPTLQQEDWRFTNVAPIAGLPFKPVFQAFRDGLTEQTVAKFTFGRMAATRLVFIDGHYCADLSSPPPDQPGLVAGSLGAVLAKDSSLVEKHLGRCAQAEENSFVALNTAFFQDGALVVIPAGVKLEAPIHLLFISTVKESGATSHPRNLIIAQPHSEATVLESYVSTIDAPYFTNAVTELVLEEGAAVEHGTFQDEGRSAFHIAAIHAQLGRNSRFISHSIATGARLSRNNIRAALAGEGVECVLNGLYLTRGDQLADHHMVVEHAQPRCTSHEYYNGILDGHSKGVFHGRILVQPGAQKTDAKQTNKNLLLSDEATVDTKPQLEIYADDVKCTHGATVGQLNEESIFYLRARGIGAKTARRMLIHAFAGEIIERVRCLPAREALDRFVWDHLEASPKVGDRR
jgi:Fe-S cluster assembly protein SufD